MSTQGEPGRAMLFVGPYPPPFGGIASHIRDVSADFSRSGIRCHILTFVADADSVDGTRNNLTVERRRIRPTAGAWRGALARLHRLPLLLPLFLKLPLPHTFVSALLRCLHIVDVCRANRLGTVGIYGSEEAVLVPILRRLMPRLRIFYTCFAAPLTKPDYYRRYKRYYELAMRQADRVLASSRYCGGAAQWLAPGLEVEVIYYGVDLEKYHPRTPRLMRERESGLEGKIVVLFLGRMIPDMGAPEALEIARAVNARRADTVFFIAGAKGSHTEVIEKAAAESGGRIRCRVNVPADELAGAYASADIVLAPTADRQACMGLAIKEAFASGTPVAVSNSGGIPEAVEHGVQGIMIPITGEGRIDVPAFVEALDRMCDDVAGRRVMGERARQRAEELFDQRITMTRVRQVYGF